MMKAWCLLGVFALGATIASADDKMTRPDAGAFVRALWAVQRYGTLDAADARYDERSKSILAGALGKDGSVTDLVVTYKLMDAKTFLALSGSDALVQSSELQKAIDTSLPDTRRQLLPAVIAHFDLLTTSFDRTQAAHLAAGDQLAEWITANYQPGNALPVIFVCTGNSRRSILGATMGNVAAAYWGLPEVRCYSGGTAPSAFDARTIATLKAIGIKIEPTGEEAARGLDGVPNPAYFVSWGKADERTSVEMETVEFSKHYSDAGNPQNGFAAIMVCTQADGECPMVKGASYRISMPFLDPKSYDDGQYEALKYAEGRDDLGRLMLAAILKARRQLEAKGKIAPPAIAEAARH